MHPHLEDRGGKPAPGHARAQNPQRPPREASAVFGQGDGEDAQNARPMKDLAYAQRDVDGYDSWVHVPA